MCQGGTRRTQPVSGAFLKAEEILKLGLGALLGRADSSVTLPEGLTHHTPTTGEGGWVSSIDRVKTK